MRLYLAVCLMAVLPSCVATNFVTGQMNAARIAALEERFRINVWSDAQEVKRRTTVRWPGGDDDFSPDRVSAPPWSYNGVSVRLAVVFENSKPQTPELQVSVFSESGVFVSLTVDGNPIESAGSAGKWARFPLTADVYRKLSSEDVSVGVSCEVDEWRFRFRPAYAKGFKAKLASYVKS